MPADTVIYGMDNNGQPFILLASSIHTPRARTLFFVCVTVAYGLAFGVLFPVMGGEVVSLALLPVAAMGWFMGLPMGVLAALLYVPLNALLLGMDGVAGWQVMASHWPVVVSTLVVAMATGWPGGCLKRMSEQCRELSREGEHFGRESAGHRLAEEALKTALEKEERERAKLETIIAAIGDGISIQDTDFRIIYQNEVVKERTGDHVGEYCFRAYKERDEVCEGCPVAESFTDGRIHVTTRSVSLARGTEHLEITASPVRDASGKIVAGIEVIRDVSERRHVEDALRQTNETLQTLIHESPLPITLIDANSNVLIWNPAAERLFGWDEEEVLGRPIPTIPQAEEEDYRALIDDAMHGKARVNRELRRVRKDGSFIDVNIWTDLLRGPQDRIIGVIVMIVDITERKQMEDALRKSEERFAQFMHSLPGISYMRDTEGRYVYVNETWKHTYCRNRDEEWLGKSLEDIWDPAIARRLREGDRQVVAGRQALQTVDRLSHGDGERYWLINRFPIPNEQGEPLFIGGIGVDISKRVGAEEALVEVQRQQQAILDNIPDLVWLKDAESRFITTNEAFAKACGVSVKDLAGKTDLDIWPRDLAKKYRRDDRYVMKSGRQKCTEELLADPAGNRIWIETFKMPIVNHRGEMAGTTGIARNINGRKRAEEELLDYQGQLKSLAAELSLAEERERRRIATELHDQIGQYLAFTRMKLNLLEHSGLSTGVASPLEEIRNYLDLIIKRVRSLTCQISPPLLYEVGFEAAVEWLGESFQEEYGFQVVFWDDRRAKPLDEEIKVTLFQVVRELLMNVAKHALAKRVQISVEGDRTWIKITVEDDGAGFDMGKIMTSRDNRCGFGLFNIRQQMAHLGGEIAFETNNGSGTRVTLLAPLREATPESGSAAVLQES